MSPIFKLLCLALIFSFSILYSISEEKELHPHLATGIVTLTFDDGYSSHYEKVLPLLEKYDLPATLYISSSLLEQPGYLTRCQLIELNSRGCEIASHGATHRNLKNLSPPEIKNELLQSKRALENIIQLPVENFAPPYGASSAQLQRILKKYYQSSRSILPRLNVTHRLNPWAINAYVVFNSTSLQQLAAWINAAIQEKKWLILVYHQIDGPDNIINISADTLESHLELIQSSHLPTLTMRAALQQIGRNDVP